MKRLSLVVVAPARQRAICRGAVSASPAIGITGESGRLTDALDLVTRHQPAVVVLGSGPGRMPLALVIAALRHRSPGTRVILLTAGMPPAAGALEAARRGAHGCLDETAVYAFLARAVVAVARGEAWFPRRIAPDLVRHLIDAERAPARGGAR
jgi:DNA-binding NarL/FixJ family response regulator